MPRTKTTARMWDRNPAIEILLYGDGSNLQPLRSMSVGLLRLRVRAESLMVSMKLLQTLYKRRLKEYAAVAKSQLSHHASLRPGLRSRESRDERTQAALAVSLADRHDELIAVSEHRSCMLHSLEQLEKDAYVLITLNDHRGVYYQHDVLLPDAEPYDFGPDGPFWWRETIHYGDDITEALLL